MDHLAAHLLTGPACPEPQPTDVDYFDLDGPIIFAPHLGTSNRLDLQSTGSRLRTPMIRNNVLWVCQHVGLAGTHGTYTGNQTGTNVDRSAIQWLELQLNSTGTPLSHIAHGRIYDTAAGLPYYYYMPSLMVNTNGDMVIGFSGCRTNEYIGAFYVGRLADGTTSRSPTLVHAGPAYFIGRVQWGAYSYPSLHPAHGSFWTVHQYPQSPPRDTRRPCPTHTT